MEDKEIAAGIPETLRKNLDWYIANQEELSRAYNGKILLIVNQALVRAFDSMEEAYSVASRDYKPGTFTLATLFSRCRQLHVNALQPRI
jgi:hypothetical protein